MEPKKKIRTQHKQYTDIQRVIADIAEAIANNQSIHDCPQISEFLRQNKFSEEIIDRFCSVEYNMEAHDSLKPYDKQKELTRFLMRLDQEKNNIEKRRKKIRRTFFSISGTAAAVAVIMITLLNPHENLPDTLQTECPVNLILSDGRTIALDDSHDDSRLELIEESGAHIRNIDGTLIVEKDSGTVAENTPNHYTLNVSGGYQYDIILEDKTHVWLNSDSYLRFPASFGADERKVFVEGEAYFEVAEDRNRPFIVETSGQTITVLGTAFNLYAYRDEPVIYTTLVSGSVSVRSATGQVTLSPNQSCGLNRYDNKFSVGKADGNSIAQWRNAEIFVFNDNTLEQVLMKVSRWYNVEIVFDKADAQKFIYKGNLPKYENIEELLENLEITGSMKFAKERNRYVMTR